ncbi:5072_t:CDS:2 [Paraglomus brasilianum]|uniref:5072_t:CDS:1 n=1 Tax=Paraglomus brasilianum TaxID=144538 RepID=A0A9N9FB59_9GLOM|nr:5072_t:CDS:2 [Paraglomus brasilianum]
MTHLLKNANQKFKYRSDLSNGFNINLCSRCHNLYQQPTALTDNTSLSENASLAEKMPLS